MSPKTFLLTALLVAFDAVSGLSLRDVEPLSEGKVVFYSTSPSSLFKRQTAQCPIGTRECARTSEGVACLAVCCYENGQFVFGCDAGYSCYGTGANAGCCPVGRICTSGPPPCVDFGQTAPAPTSACPASLPACTTNDRGASICSGSITQTSTRSFTLTRTNTVTTTTSEPETETETETETSSTEMETTMTTTMTEETTSTTEVTMTTTSEIPTETTTVAVTTTEVETVTYLPPTTSAPTYSSNATFVPLPPATSSSGRIATVNLLLGLVGIAFAFFLC